jgi:hypothetical protein
MLEALVAVGLAGNVVQFIQFAGELITETKVIRRAGHPSRLPDLRKLTDSLIKQADIIHTHLQANIGNQTTGANLARRQEDEVRMKAL